MQGRVIPSFYKGEASGEADGLGEGSGGTEALGDGCGDGVCEGTADGIGEGSGDGIGLTEETRVGVAEGTGVEEGAGTCGDTESKTAALPALRITCRSAFRVLNMKTGAPTIVIGFEINCVGTASYELIRSFAITPVMIAR